MRNLDAKRPDDWQATRAQTALATQFLKNEDDYLNNEPGDIGRQIGVDEHELFVSCDPAQAMQQQFEHLRPEFIAVHDIATVSSRRLLAGIAAASARAVQKLVIRRQGYGTALATLEFVELPTTDRRPLRLYSTAVDADTAARHGLAQMLLAFSRLCAVMVGDLPAHAIASALKPLHDGMVAGPWPNRSLLLLPLAATSTLSNHGIELARGTRVAVRTTPMVARPADAWGFIAGTWSRLREQNDTGSARVPALAAFTLPSNTRPARDLQDPALLQRYVKQVGELNGVVGCCVFDHATGATLAQALGSAGGPAAVELARHGSTLLAAMAGAGHALGLGSAQPEAAITLAAHHLLLRAVPKNPTLTLHAVLDKSVANLTLMRLQVLRMDALFEEAAVA